MCRAILLVLCVLLAGCVRVEVRPAPAPAPVSDIEATWKNAVVVLPDGDGDGDGDQVISTTMGSDAMMDWLDQRSGGRLPVVLYMHGCTGIGNFKLFAKIAAQGFVVVAPDSMARQYRPLQCNPETKTGGQNLFVYAFRQAEISFTLQQLQRLPWVDRRNIFLVGTSEGGVAAALYRGDEFRARVIAQWTCSGSSLVRGLSAPDDEPVLAVAWADDPWNGRSRTKWKNGNCEDYFGNRPESKQIRLTGRSSHNVFGDDEVTEKVLVFLKRWERP